MHPLHLADGNLQEESQMWSGEMRGQLGEPGDVRVELLADRLPRDVIV